MTYVGAERVAGDVGSPFVLCCVAGADADVAGLEGFEVLLGAEFVGHFLKAMVEIGETT